MLTGIQVMGAAPQTFPIEGVDPDAVLVLKSISGLTSALAGVQLGEYARAGGYYQGRRPPQRNVVLTFKINPDYAGNVEVSDVRETLYRMFMEPYDSGAVQSIWSEGSDGVRVHLNDDRRPQRYFVGYCESIEVDHFETPTIKATVSLLVPDPWLKSVVDKFYEANNGLPSGNVYNFDFAYAGSADTGFYAQLRTVAATPRVTLELNGAKMIVDKASGNWTAGTLITFDTRDGLRAVKVNSVDSMALLSPESRFLQIGRSASNMKAYGTYYGDVAVKLEQLSYTDKWWGV